MILHLVLAEAGDLSLFKNAKTGSEIHPAFCSRAPGAHSPGRGNKVVRA